MKSTLIAGILTLLLGSSAVALHADGTSAYQAGCAARTVVIELSELRLVPVRIHPSFLLEDEGVDVPTPCSLVK